MENKAERRWGIVAVAVAMFFVTMVNTSINGQKSSIYYAVWFFVGLYGYRGNLDSIKSLMKFLILLNLVVLVGVVLFVHDDAYTYMYREGTKESLIFGVLLMCIPKIFLYFYCDKEIKANESQNQLNTTNSEKINSEIKNNSTTQTEANNKSIKSNIQNNVSMEDAYINATQHKNEVHPTIKKNVQETIDNKKIASMEDAYSHLSAEKISISNNKEPIKIEDKKIDEEKIWELVAEEFDSESRKKGLYAKLFSETEGDETKIKALYYKIRVEEILKETKKTPNLINSEIILNAEEKENSFVESRKINELKSEEECISQGLYKKFYENGYECLDLENGRAIVITPKRKIIYENLDALNFAMKEFRNSGKFIEVGVLKEIRETDSNIDLMLNDEVCIDEGLYEVELIKGFRCLLLKNGRAVIDIENSLKIFKNIDDARNALAEYRATKKINTTNMVREIYKNK